MMRCTALYLCCPVCRLPLLLFPMLLTVTATHARTLTHTFVVRCRYGSEIAPYAVEMAGKLVVMFNHYRSQEVS
jgi:hypothetical protein